MATAYLIGGAPRVGKTSTLLKAIGVKPMLSASTDAIRMMLRTAINEQDSPMLFRNKFNASRIDAMKQDPKLVVDDQNDESRIVWGYTTTFIASNLEDGMDIGIEGVAILPELLTQADFPYRVVYLVNLEDQTDSILNHARTNQSDWLHTYDDETIRAFCSFNQLLNRYYFEEATKYGYPLIEVHSDSFNEDINGAVSILLHS